jgi:hypothetical protein
MSDPSRLPHGLRFSPQLLYHEPDEAFHLGLWRSRSGVATQQPLTTCRFSHAGAPFLRFPPPLALGCCRL